MHTTAWIPFTTKKVYEECLPPSDPNIHVGNDELIVANEDNFIVIGENSMYKDSLSNEQHFEVLQDVIIQGPYL